MLQDLFLKFLSIKNTFKRNEQALIYAKTTKNNNDYIFDEETRNFNGFDLSKEEYEKERISQEYLSDEIILFPFLILCMDSEKVKRTLI